MLGVSFVLVVTLGGYVRAGEGEEGWFGCFWKVQEERLTLLDTVITDDKSSTLQYSVPRPPVR